MYRQSFSLLQRLEVSPNTISFNALAAGDSRNWHEVLNLLRCMRLKRCRVDEISCFVQENAQKTNGWNLKIAL